MITKARVRGAAVKVYPGLTVAEFRGGEAGESDAGVYCFWTALCSDGAQITARAFINLDPGERFRRMGREQRTAAKADDRLIYRDLWKSLKGIRAIRPAQPRDVTRWLANHPVDSDELMSLHFYFSL